MKKTTFLILCVALFFAGLTAKAQTPYEGVRAIIPGKMECENYDLGGEGVGYHEIDDQKYGDASWRPDDMVDVEGDYIRRNVGWVNPGEWLKYSVDVKVPGEYTLMANLNMPTPGTGTSLWIDGDSISSYVATQASGWGVYKVDTLGTLTLTAGEHIITIRAEAGLAGNWDYFEFTLNTATGQAPYLGIAQTIPGKVECEYYDYGGEGVGYHEVDDQKYGDATWRPEDMVDVEGNNDRRNVGWVNPGEWLKFTVNVNYSGDYALMANLNMPTPGTGTSLWIDGDSITTYVATQASGWGVYAVDTLDTLALTAGAHEIEIRAEAGQAGNWDYFEFVLDNPTGEAPYKGVAQTIPGRVEFEYYDLGGEGIAYHEVDDQKYGDATWRPEDMVDVEGNDDRRNIGWVNPGEWVKFTVNVKKSKEYYVTASLNMPTPGAGTTLFIDGDSVTTYIASQASGWGVYAVDTLDTLALEVGEHIFEFRAEAGLAGNWDYFQFSDPMISTNANISSIKLDDVAIAGFASDILEYDIELPTGTTEHPAITATASDLRSTVVIVDTATTFPSTSYVKCTAEDGYTTKVYAINYTVAPVIIDAVETTTVNNNVFVYPNPTNSVLTLSSVEGVNSVRIMNLTGMVIMVKDVVNASIDVSSLPSGMYILQLEMENEGYKSLKFQKN